MMARATIVRWLAWLVLAAASAPAHAAELAFTLKEVGPGVYAAIDIDGKAGANAGIVIGKEAVLVVDTFYSVTAAKALLTEARRLSPKPVRFVVNTHHHIDHVAGNGVFAAAGATVIAQRNVRYWIHDENIRLMGGDAASADERAAVAALRAPDAGYGDALEIDLGGRVVLLRHLGGHTGGDTVVWVADAKVLFGGDLVWHRTAPNLIDAQVEAWLATLAVLERAPAGTVFVPGHGAVGSVSDVAQFRGYLSDLRAFAVEARASGVSDAEARVLARMRETYGDWAFFKGLGPAAVTHMMAELGGTKRTPTPAGDRALFE